MLAMDVPAPDNDARLARCCAQQEPFIVELLFLIDGEVGPKMSVLLWYRPAGCNRWHGTSETRLAEKRVR